MWPHGGVANHDRIARRNLNGMRNRETPRRLHSRTAILLTLAFCLLSCSSSREVSSSTGPASVKDSGEASVTLKVMSFNVLWGAGHDRRFDGNVSPRFRRDRLPELMVFLREAAPDILVAQEAAGWETGNPSVAEQIAADLGMNYVLAPDAWELHVVLFSKPPIVTAAYVSRLQGFNGVALMATLAVTPEAEVNVIAVHLNSMSGQTRSCQVEVLLDVAEVLSGRTLLLGDMNFRPGAPQADALRAADWQLVRAQAQWPIDQIWVDASASVTTGVWWDGLEAPARISDHWPVGVDITLTVPRSSKFVGREPMAAPDALDYACAVPS